MATPSPTAATPYEKALAWLTILLTVMALAAVAKGRAEWAQIPAVVWFHLGSLLVALVLTPVLLLRRRGDGRHRQLGWVWATAMMLTALFSLRVRVINPGHFSPIHLLSVLVIVSVPLLVWRARNHQVAAHRRSIRGIVTGGIIVAGFLTFPFGRLLGHWLFS